MPTEGVRALGWFQGQRGAHLAVVSWFDPAGNYSGPDTFHLSNGRESFVHGDATAAMYALVLEVEP